jgi:receptor protein-tyrosine kinase/non-specific protein-tyrosine kinase
MPEFTGTKDLREYARILWRWKLLFLVFVIGAPVAVYLIERGKPNVYQSSALVGIGQETVDTTVLGNANGSFSTTNVQAIAQLVTTRPVAQVAARFMRPPANPGQIVGEVSASGDATTNFLTISAVDQNPRRAAEIANAFAHAISFNRQKAAITELNTAIAGIQAQLRQAGGNVSPNSQQASNRAQLVQQLDQFQAAKATKTSNAAILQTAVPSATPAGPHLRRTVELALLIGLLLGLGAVVLAENADRRLRTPDALEHMADVPLLATIPPSAFSSKLDTGPADEESFQMLRTALVYFNPSERLQSVIVTSPGEKDGKTTVTTRLALAAARAGMNVVLMDADLRRAQVGPRLGIDAAVGLGAVLAGDKSLEEVLFRYPVDEPGAGELKVLPAGSPPANPAALISSKAMERALRRLEDSSDLVVIDSPAALMVSDPLPLIELATGVILVARMNRSTRERISRLRKIVSAAHGTLFGVVATGATTGLGYDHYTSGYYTQNGTGRFGRRGREPEPRAGGGLTESRASAPTRAAQMEQQQHDSH